jgi:hypothetical protein
MKTNIMERNKIIFAFFTVLIALSMSLAACGASPLPLTRMDL